VARKLATFVAALALWSTAAIPQNIVGNGITGDAKSGGAPPLYATLTTTNGNVTLTNSNTGISVVTGGGGARTQTPHSTGKYYFEFTATNITSAISTLVGVCTSAWGDTFNGYDGTTTSSGAFDSNAGGGLYINDSPVASPTITAAWSTNTVVGVAFDAGAGLIWFSTDGSSWNNGTSTANVLLGMGGISVGGMTLSGTYFYACMSAFYNGETARGNFGPSSGYSYTGLIGSFGYW
jgi:hypothetical protein